MEAKTICEKLGITSAELESMYTLCDVDGATGAATVAKLEARFGTADPDELAAGGILTAAEDYCPKCGAESGDEGHSNYQHGANCECGGGCDACHDDLLDAPEGN